MRAETTAIRLAAWKQIFKKRTESGLTIVDFCEQNGVSRDAYFYWQRKARAEFLEQKGEARFAELMPPTDDNTKSPNVPSSSVQMLSVTVGSAKVEVPEGTSKELFSMVMGVLANAE